MNFKVGDVVTECSYKGTFWRIEGPASDGGSHWWLNFLGGDFSQRAPDRIERFNSEIKLSTPYEEPVDEIAEFFS